MDFQSTVSCCRNYVFSLLKGQERRKLDPPLIPYGYGEGGGRFHLERTGAGGWRCHDSGGRLFTFEAQCLGVPAGWLLVPAGGARAVRCWESMEILWRIWDACFFFFFLKRSEDDEVNICKLPSVRIFRSKSVAWIFFRLLKNTEKPFLYYLGLFDGDLMWCTKVTKVLTQCWRFGCHLRRLQQGLLADLWSIASWAGGWRKWRITGNQQGGLDDFYAYGSNMWASSAPRWIGIMKMNGFMLRRNIFYNVLYIAVGFCFSVVSTGFIYVWLSCYWSLYIPDMCIVVTIKMDMVSAEQLGCPWFHFPYPER